jgi:hypothetical protein
MSYADIAAEGRETRRVFHVVPARVPTTAPRFAFSGGLPKDIL